ncbi:MAG: hypothetical protein PVI30_10620 [Myxococcales bacterium]|jgi:hypothetical protein
MDRKLGWLVQCGAVALFACSGGGEPSEPAPAASSGAEQQAAPAKQDEGPTLQGHMATNFKLALETRDAIVDGDLPTAQQKAKDLAWQNYEGVLPERWMPGVEKMQQSARAVAESTTLQDAAHHVAALASTCGECHARFESDAEESEQHHGFSAKEGEDLQTRMLRHQRAADGFWFGLTIPSDASWRSGARALTEAPEGPVMVEGEPANPELEAQMEKLQAMGKRALAAEAPEERVKVYGDMLASCSGCHET